MLDLKLIRSIVAEEHIALLHLECFETLLDHVFTTVTTFRWLGRVEFIPLFLEFSLFSFEDLVSLGSKSPGPFFSLFLRSRFLLYWSGGRHCANGRQGASSFV